MRNTATRVAVSILSFGLILAYCAAASSGVFADFAPLSLTPAYLYVASFVAGLAMALMYSETWAAFGGTVLIAVVAGLIFAAALVIAILSADPRLAELIGLYVFQQAFPRSLSICVFGLSGAFLAAVGRHMFGSG